MPSKLEHDTQRELNISLADFLTQEERSLDWVATILFYACLHAVEGYLATHGLHLKAHVQRTRILQQKFRDVYAPIQKDYEEMEQLSRSSRYDCARPTSTDIQEQRQRLVRIIEHLSATAEAESSD